MDKYVKKYKNKDGFTIYYIDQTSCCGKKVEWLRGESSENCPHCGNKYYKKPNLENKLFCLQDEFVDDFNKTGSTKILGEKMFPLMQEYAVNLIKAMIKGKKSLSTDELTYRSWDAAALLIEVILRDPEHRMRYSFGKYLGDLCKSVCYSTKNHEHTYSLNSILKDGTTELGEVVAVSLEKITDGFEKEGSVSVSDAPLSFDYKEDTLEKLVELVAKSAKVLYTTTDSYLYKLLYLLGLLMKFKAVDDRLLAKFFEEVGKPVKSFVEKGELVIYKELRDLLE